MNLEAVLRDKIKPELNFLYTEEPAWRDGGGDFGWFCREHAYHCYFLSKMLKAECRIVRGHISIHTAEGNEVLSSFGEDSDHAWLAVDDVCPVDVSVSLAHSPTTLPMLDLVYGTGIRGSYFVTYETATTTCTETPPGMLHHIRYAETRVVMDSPESLLADPFIFLTRPKRGGLAQLFGSDIFDRITYHLYRVSIGEIKPYYRDVNPVVKAFERIKSKNPEAAARVRELLGIL